ncbi:hypothetical protein TNCV_1165431 [Trichonephila clavipes]|nr:hypothetical protein TNCV_1165431 [Trichonephila clavipes]
MTLGAEVRVEMFRSSGELDVKPTVFSSQASLILKLVYFSTNFEKNPEGPALAKNCHQYDRKVANSPNWSSTRQLTKLVVNSPTHQIGRQLAKLVAKND